MQLEGTRWSQQRAPPMRASLSGGSVSLAAHRKPSPLSRRGPCQQRCLCPSCHQKRTLLTAETIAQTICAPAPHRQLVFTIPKRLRVFCRHDRSLLGKLARAAWQATVEVYRQVLGRRDVPMRALPRSRA